MSEIDDGVIKYDTSAFIESPPLPLEEVSELEYWRKRLFQIKLIGEYLPERIGYGNLSVRKNYSNFEQTLNSQFVITGTQTGGVQDLNGSHYTRVLNFDFKTWSVKAMGPIKASSEALTHAAIYEANKENINAVFHIHSKEIWNGMIKENYLSTAQNIPYGTEEMATAVINCVDQNTSGIIVMKGHEDGVISFAPDMKTAYNLIMEVYDKFCK
jgi:ribulose-5-phosphate 4-epimerase/fuculose-1-phosphate aldolase